jgi:uncharacterized protein (TIGR02594 family)
VSTQGRPPSFFDDADAETPVTGTTPTPVDPPWLAIARGELGTRELVNGKANPKIAEYFQATGFKGGDAQDAWCSAFVNACMKRAGIRGTNSASAQSWLRWGIQLDEPRLGCVCVFSRPPNPGNGHVAFFISREKNWIHVLSGNQNNMVCVKPYAADRLFDSGMRWPEGVP